MLYSSKDLPKTISNYSASIRLVKVKFYKKNNQKYFNEIKNILMSFYDITQKVFLQMKIKKK